MLGVFPGSDAFGKELLQLPSEMWLYSLAKTGQEKENPYSGVIRHHSSDDAGREDDKTAGSSPATWRFGGTCCMDYRARPKLVMVMPVRHITWQLMGQL